MTAKPEPSRTARQALDALNFFAADVRDGLGPFLAIYLLTVQKWDEASIGAVMSAAAIAGIVAQTPAGALVDGTTFKRGLIVVAAFVVTASSLVLPFIDSHVLVVATQSIAAMAGALFAPGIAALTLGIAGPKAFAKNIGRNEGFNHAGNAVAAGLAALLGYSFGPAVVFWLMAAMTIMSIVSVLFIPADAIDNNRARGLTESDDTQTTGTRPSRWNVMLKSRPLMIFAACNVLFHFANAAMLPLVGQKLAAECRRGHVTYGRLYRRGAVDHGARGTDSGRQG